MVSFLSTCDLSMSNEYAKQVLPYKASMRTALSRITGLTHPLVVAENAIGWGFAPRYGPRRLEKLPLKGIVYSTGFS